MSKGTAAGSVDAIGPLPGVGAKPTLDNWLLAPGNRWAFRHARELFRSERVRARAGTPFSSSDVKRVPDLELGDYLQRSATDAFLVSVDGALTDEWFAPGVRPDDRHMIFSCTKSVVGIVGECLIAEGRLDEAATVAEYLPELGGSGYAGATVRALLDMTADIAFTEDYDGPDVRAFRVASGQIESADSPGIRAYTASLHGGGAHGHVVRYVSPTTDLLGWLCEFVTGESLAELISSYVWVPMGADFEGDLLLDRFGAARASGGLCASAHDMLRIGLLFLRDDLPQPLAAAMEALKQPGDARAWAAGSLAEFIPGASYRSYWYQLPSGPGVYLAAGIYGQRIYVDLPRRVVIVQQSSLSEAFDPVTWQETLPVFERVAGSVSSH